MKNTIIEILEEVTGTDEIREELDFDLFEAGLIDSLGIIDILLAIEEKLGIRLQPTDLSRDDMKSVNSLVTFLSKKGA